MLSTQTMDCLRTITSKIKDLIWLTGADMLSGNPNVNLTLAPGLARSLMMEQPSLRFVIMDIGKINSLDEYLKGTCANIERVLLVSQDTDDKEYIQHNGMLYVSRLYPDFAINSLFRRRLQIEESVRMASLGDVQPVQVSIGRPGVADTIHFNELRDLSPEVPPDFIDVKVQAVSLNAKDVYALHGIVETRTNTKALEFTGTVIATGRDVDHLYPGDRVLVCMPNNFATVQRVPAWQAHRLMLKEDVREMSTLLVTNVAALYALRDRAHLRAGETILIHSGAGAFGIACIKMAQRMGAIVYTTVGSAKRRDYLVENLGRHLCISLRLVSSSHLTS